MERKYKEEGNTIIIMGSAQMVSIERNMHDLYALLKRQYDIYEAIHALCEEDHQFIEHGEIESLRKSIGKKHVLLNEIVHIEKDITVLKEEWNRYKEQLGDPLKKDIMVLLGNFKDLMDKIMVRQKENEKVFSDRNTRHLEELHLVRKGKNLSKAYSVYGDSIPHSRFMDKTK